MKGSVARAAALAVAVTACSACMAGAISTVQAKAAAEFTCPEKDVTVTKVEDKDAKTGAQRHLFRAEGCGKHSVYLCEGWDPSQQVPACDPDPNGK